MIKVNRLALCLAFGRRLVIMCSLHLPPPPHKHQDSPISTMRQRIRSSQRPSEGLRASQARGQQHCHTCMESALTISPPSRWPSCTARVDLPVPVAPRITTRGSVRCTPRSPGPKETARAAAAAAILKTLKVSALARAAVPMTTVSAPAQTLDSGGRARRGREGAEPRSLSLRGSRPNCHELAGVRALTKLFYVGHITPIKNRSIPIIPSFTTASSFSS